MSDHHWLGVAIVVIGYLVLFVFLPLFFFFGLARECQGNMPAGIRLRTYPFAILVALFAAGTVRGGFDYDVSVEQDTLAVIAFIATFALCVVGIEVGSRA